MPLTQLPVIFHTSQVRYAGVTIRDFQVCPNVQWTECRQLDSNWSFWP